MSVFGIDFGTLNSTVAITRQGGVDIITNEVSKRETTTMVTFVDDERFIGEQALDRYVRNAKNTAFLLKRLVGMRMTDPQLEIERKWLTCAIKGDAHDRLMMGVQYCGELTYFYPEQVLAMLFQKLKQYVNEAAQEAGRKATDVRSCTITVPIYYTAEQRTLIYQAAECAGLQCMTLVNECTAVAVDYGIFRGAHLKETEEEGQLVGILDIGYASTTFSIYKFWRGNCRSLAHAFDRNCGTRAIDDVLFTEMQKEVKAKYHVDVAENQRASLRILQACEKLKYLLSANQTAPFNVENVMDVDINIPSFDRGTLESLSAGVVERVRAVLQHGLVNAGVEASALHSIEMIGGGCRIPMFKALVESVLGRVPSFTLNASESVVRGCAVIAAVHSPLFQVRDFKVQQISTFPISLGYRVESTHHPVSVPFLPDVNKVVPVLSAQDTFPKMLDITIPYSGKPLKLYAFYDYQQPIVQREVVPSSYLLGEWEVAVTTTKHDIKSVKLRLDLRPDGLIVMESARGVMVVPAEAAPAGDQAAPAPAPAGAEQPAPAEAPAEKAKPKHKYYEATVSPRMNLLGHDSDNVLRFRKAEGSMHDRDTVIIRTREKKNELESYILDLRPKLSVGGSLEAYATAENKATFLARCDEYESWLYEDGDASTLEEYASRIAVLHAIGVPAQSRYLTREELQFAVTRFTAQLNDAKATALAKIGKAPHITEEELKAVAAKADEASQWGAAEVQKVLALPLTENASFTVADLNRKVEEVSTAIRVVVNRPVPKPKPEPKPAAPPAKPEEPAPAAAPEAPADGPAPAEPELD